MALEETDVERVSDVGGQEAVERQPIPEYLRWDIYLRDGFRCHYCGGHRNLSIDHVVPIIEGGLTDHENLITACRTCNSSKGPRPYSQMETAIINDVHVVALRVMARQVISQALKGEFSEGDTLEAERLQIETAFQVLERLHLP